MRTKINYRNMNDLPDTIPSGCGEDIYKWVYLDENGKLKKSDEDVYSKIQSYTRSTEYKHLIKKGELSNDRECIYMDTSKLGDGYTGLLEYLDGIRNSITEVTKRGTEEVGAHTQESGEVAPTCGEDKSKGGAQ